jgi:hypothetical protein
MQGTPPPSSTPSVLDDTSPHLVVELQPVEQSSQEPLQDAISNGSDSHDRRYPTETPHLNPLGLHIRCPEGSSRGRGVYAPRDLKRGTLLDISPVLIIPKEQYEAAGGVIDRSVLGGYVFTWNWGSKGGKNGDMALALGLGARSIFLEER